jgi:hypothetical protein
MIMKRSYCAVVSIHFLKSHSIRVIQQQPHLGWRWFKEEMTRKALFPRKPWQINLFEKNDVTFPKFFQNSETTQNFCLSWLKELVKLVSKSDPCRHTYFAADNSDSQPYKWKVHTFDPFIICMFSSGSLVTKQTKVSRRKTWPEHSFSRFQGEVSRRQQYNLHLHTHVHLFRFLRTTQN